MMKRFHFSLLMLFMALYMLGCRPTELVTPTPTVAQLAAATVAVERPSAIPTATPIPSATATTAATATPTMLAAATSTPWDVPSLEPSSTSIPTDTRQPTETPTPLPTVMSTPRPLATLPTGLPEMGTWTGIGTAVPPASAPITADNLTELTEVARWGKGRIIEALYSPDGSHIYALTWQGVYVYDAATAQQLDFRPYNGIPYTMALSSDGQTLAVATSYYVELRQAATNEFITAFFPFEDGATFIHQLAFDQGNQTLFAYSAGKAEVVAWDIAAATAVTTLTNANNFAFAPQSQMAVTDDGASLQVWQWQNGAFTAVATLEIPPEVADEFRILAISPDGQYVAAGQNFYGMVAVVWQVTDGELLHILDNLLLRPRVYGKRLGAPPQVSGPGRDYLSHLQFSPDSQMLAITTGFQNLVLWDVASGQSLRQLDEVGDEVMFTPDGTAVAVRRHTLSQWRIEDGSFINTFNQHIGGITDLALVPQRNQLAIASADRFVYLRRFSDGALVSSLRAGVGNSSYYAPPAVIGIDVTADGNTLVSASNDAYRLWNLDDYDMIELLPPPRGDIGPDDVVVSFDGQYILGREHDSGGGFWQMNEGVWQEYGGGPAFSPSAVAFSPTDVLLATTEFFGEGMFLWQPDPWTSQDLPLDTSLVDMNRGVKVFAFATDGRILAAGASEGRVLLWAINDNLEASFLRMIEISDTASDINSITFSQDNNLLIVRTAYDVWFLDVNDGRLLQRQRMTVGAGVLLSADGRYLITGHADGTVRFWAVP